MFGLSVVGMLKHGKTCDVKDSNQKIYWVPPQVGEELVYPNM